MVPITVIADDDGCNVGYGIRVFPLPKGNHFHYWVDILLAIKKCSIIAYARLFNTLRMALVGVVDLERSVGM
jgi:hypothetical protein